jgi:molybdopterin converting factor small subunit
MNLASSRAPDPPAPCGSGVDGPATVILLLFAEARVAAGTGREELSARSVAEVLDAARGRHGSRFGAVLERSRVWVNGEPAPPERLLTDGDEVAILPPVSGGSTG